VRAHFAILVALLLIGCNREHRTVIGVVSKGQAHQFWQTVHAGADAAGKEFQVDILWNGPAEETDFGRQIEIVDSMTSRRVNALAIAPVERKALVQSVERAVKSGIPVTVYDSGLEFNDYVSFVATNNYQAGELAAREMGRQLNGKGTVIALNHMPGSASSMDRERAFQVTLSKEFPNIRIVGEQYGMGDRAKVLAAAENLLTAHPEVNGMFASAESSSFGAVRALKARHLNGKVKLVAFDFTPDLISALEDGTVSALVVQDPFRIGYEAVKTLAQKLKGETPPRTLDLSARVVTKPDLQDADVRRMLTPP
jgi:ribose transport system substrate-binding protein